MVAVSDETRRVIGIGAFALAVIGGWILVNYLRCQQYAPIERVFVSGC
jgi:hypothetical protein